MCTFMRDSIISKCTVNDLLRKNDFDPLAASPRHLTGRKAVRGLTSWTTWLLLLEVKRYEYIFSWSVITVTVHISFNSRPPPPPLPFPTSPPPFRTSPPSPNSSYRWPFFCLSHIGCRLPILITFEQYFMEILLQGKYIIIVCVAI